jgi:hypothetical protein
MNEVDAGRGHATPASFRHDHDEPGVKIDLVIGAKET